METSVTMAVANPTLNIVFVINLIYLDAELRGRDLHDPLLMHMSTLEHPSGNDV